MVILARTSLRGIQIPILILITNLLSYLTNNIFTHANEISHKYEPNEPVHIYVHKVGPYANPQEAYHYYSLPYCNPSSSNDNVDKSDADANTIIQSSSSIGEYLGGHVLRHSGYVVPYASSNNNNNNEPIVASCTTQPLTEEQAQQFKNAAKHSWFYQLYVDDLPVWGLVGAMVGSNAATAEQQQHGAAAAFPTGDETPFVYTKRTLTIHYNQDRIIQVDLISDLESLIEIKPNTPITFVTEFIFQPTTNEFHSRFERYLDYDFFKHQIHWFSILNSFMMVLFLMGLVALILLRTLKRDYARYGMITTSGGGGGVGLVSGRKEKDEEGGYASDHSSDSEEYDHVNTSTENKPFLSTPSSKSNNNTAIPNEESGWKLIHGDVFRSPYLLPLVASLLGTGWQLIVLTFGVILFAVAGPLHGEIHEDRGEVQHAVLYCYCLSSVVAGYVSGSYYKRYYGTRMGGVVRSSKQGKSGNGSGGGDSQWQLAMILTVLVLPSIVVSILSALNGIAWYYDTIYYIPFLVILKLFLIWTFLSVPLCIVGTLVGRHAKLGGGSGVGGGGGAGGKKKKSCFEASEFPCRVNAIPRPIPEEVPWYGKPMNIIPFAGLLSFGSIFIELYYVLTSLWNYKFYHVYGFLLGVYTILAIVVSMTTIIVVYFTLNAENYLWQWTALFSGGSTAGYVFLYGIYFYIFKTEMSGFLQTMFYFGYMFLIALNLGMLCGTIGHFAASRFVFTIFKNVKID